MAVGKTNVQIVTAPIDATSIKTAYDACVTAIGAGVGSLSGSYMTTSFNDGRGMAIMGIQST